LKIKLPEISTSSISPAAPTLLAANAGLRRSAPEGRPHFRFRRTAFLLIVTPVLLIAAVAGIVAGSTHVDWNVAIHVIGARVFPFWIDRASIERADDVIIWLIRTPRVIVAALVGGGLAVAGALMQGLFRNPLAESNTVGVGSGAVLGAMIVFSTGLAAKSAIALPIAAFLGALLALITVYSLATRGGVTPVSMLLLTGIALSALLISISSLLLTLSVANWEVAEEMIFWMSGGLDKRTWTHVWICAPFILFAFFASLYYARDLDLLMQGEDTAASLGVNVESTKRAIIVISALITGSAIAVAGAVGFVGLVVPHIVRLFVGPSHRSLLPSSAVAGAAFVIFCDLLARTIHPPTEIRLGVITAAFGAPFFLFILVRKYREMSV
jgi:cobalamin transport system permease protein